MKSSTVSASTFSSKMKTWLMSLHYFAVREA